MGLNSDIKNAIKIINNEEDNKVYKKVKIFPSFSLKHFKKYKLNNRQVLSKVNSIDEIFELLSYNSIVTCYSTNKLDEYFLNLLLTMHNIDRKKYLDFILYDYGKFNRILSKKYYDIIRNELDENTKYFFDTLYDYCIQNKKSMANLIERQPLKKEELEIFIKSYLSKSYNNINENKRVTYFNHSGKEIINIFEKETFDFINLSYNIEGVSDKRFNVLKDREKKYINLLKENAQMQSFVSRSIKDIEGYKILKTRSMLDKNNEELEDYAYVYRKSQ